MSTPTVVLTNLTTWDAADATTGWSQSGGGGLATYSGFNREGTNCLGDQSGAANDWDAWHVGISSDLSNQRVYVWLAAFNSVDTKANGGFRIVLGDGTNRRSYYVGGSEDFGFQVGQWSCFVLDTANLPANYNQLAGSAAPSLTAITEIGGGIRTTTKALGPVDNVYIDIVRHGTGLIVYGGSLADPITLSELAADDASTASGKAYGIIREMQSGVFGVQGDIIWGDNAGTNALYWKDQDAVVVVEDHVHGTGTPTAINIDVVANATHADQHVELGVAIGTGDAQSGSNGVQFRNASTVQSVSMDFSDADLHELELYGCSLLLVSGGITFSDDATLGIAHRVSGTTFDDCGQIIINRVKIRNCFVNNYSGTVDGAILWNENEDIANCDFISNTRAIEHPASGGSPYTWDNLVMTSNTYDANNTSGSAITVNNLNGSNGSTSTGSAVSFKNTVTLKVTTRDPSGNLLEGIRVRIEDDPNGTLYAEGTTNASGVYQDTTYNYTVDEAVNVICRLKGFKYFRTKSTIIITGLDVPVTMTPDGTVDLP